MQINIKLFNELAVVPQYAKQGDAAMDLVATSVEYLNGQIKYGTGVGIEIPEGYVGLIFPRSSVVKTALSLANSVGVIDSGYRGEIFAVFNNDEGVRPIYKVGERIAQIIILPYPKVEFVAVDELSETERGDGGFGSTGK